MTTSEPLPAGGTAWWPTPRATDWKNSVNKTGKRTPPEAAAKRGWALSEAARLAESGQWPPPPAEDDPELTLFAADSLVSPSPPLAAAAPRTTRGGFGQRWRRSFADYNPGTSSWRTFQGSLLAEWETYSETWPRAGMTRNGTAYQLPPSAPLTDATASGSWPTPSATLGIHAGLVTPAKAREGGTLVEALSAHMWPTPSAKDSAGSRNFRLDGTPYDERARYGPTLTDVARAWPTPTARLGHRRGPQAKRYFNPARSNDLDDAVAAAGTTGQLNPTWVEWLMGYPEGWTDCGD
jgi:hypothetical protein